MSLQVAVETITPNIADHLLKMNKNNRSVKPGRVRRYSYALANNEWQLNGETIKIGADGRVLDGQHRLLAIIDSGVPMTTLVVRNAADTVFRTIDTGVNRNAGDTLQIEGYPNSRVLAAAAFGYIAIERGGDFSGVNVTTKTIEQTIEDHPLIVPITQLFISCKAKRVTPAYAISVCTVGAELHSVDDAQEFLQTLTEGTGLQKNNSIWLLRERLMADKANTKSHLTRVQRTAITIKAWNYYIQRKPMTILRWGIDEAFPEVR